MPAAIKELKAQLPAEVDGVRPASPLDGEIEFLEGVRGLLPLWHFCICVVHLLPLEGGPLHICSHLCNATC